MTDPDREATAMPMPTLSQFDFHPRLAEITGAALVMFSSPDCGGCRHLRGVLQEVAQRVPDWHIFEVDAQRDPALGNEFEVFHLPSVFLFLNGQFHCQLQTEARLAAIIAATRTALHRPAEEAP